MNMLWYYLKVKELQRHGGCVEYLQMDESEVSRRHCEGTASPNQDHMGKESSEIQPALLMPEMLANECEKSEIKDRIKDPRPQLSVSMIRNPPTAARAQDPHPARTRTKPWPPSPRTHPGPAVPSSALLTTSPLRGSAPSPSLAANSSIQQRLAFAARRPSREPSALAPTRFLPCMPALHPTAMQLDLGTTRNFSSGGLIFQQLKDHICIVGAPSK
ncbi:hypothetical protein DFH09DRAFT_1096901 [Mycena vulgaris]|nr:hypothetical protein DFH09DRAFT_1096901 [Mycena vulgaris]